MILLSGASDVLRIVTSSTATIDGFAAYADLNGTTVTPGRNGIAVSTASTTTLATAPGAAIQRTIRFISICNTHASTGCTVTVQFFDGTNARRLFQAVLAAGEALHYDEANGWQCINAAGLPKSAQSDGQLSPAVNSLNTVVLSADVINNNATLNTLQNVTGMSFAVNAGETYWFEFSILYTAAATTTGSRWTVTGPAFTQLAYWQQWSLTVATLSLGSQAAYQLPAASNASSAATAGNIALVGGFITPSASGTLQLQFASEIASSAITAKAGSLLRWYRVI